MADVEWVKLSTQLFDDVKIKAMRRDFKQYKHEIISLWIYLIVTAGKLNQKGMLAYSNGKPVRIIDISEDVQMEEEVVRDILQGFLDYGLIEIKNGVIALNNWGKHQSVDKLEKIKQQNRDRQARYRAKKSLTESIENWGNVN